MNAESGEFFLASPGLNDPQNEDSGLETLFTMNQTFALKFPYL